MNKPTPFPWFGVNYAGTWNIQSAEFYDAPNILNEYDVGEIQAMENVRLIQSIPTFLDEIATLKAQRDELLEACEDQLTLLYSIGCDDESEAVQSLKKAIENCKP